MHLRKPVQPPLRENGVAVAGAVVDFVTVAGPGSYATGGVPVDLSARYSRIIAVSVLRVRSAAGGLLDVLLGAANETGTDLFVNGKFRVKFWKALADHTHTYDKTNTPVAGPSGLPAGGAVVNPVDTAPTTAAQSPGLNPTVGAAGLAADDATHTHSVDRNWLLDHVHALAYTVTASGNTAAGNSIELGAGSVVLSVGTIELLVLGVPA